MTDGSAPPIGEGSGPVTVVPMDPRIRRRRVEVRRDEGRKRLRILLGCAGVVAAALAAVGVSRSPLLDVDYVQVRGAEQTGRLQVVAAGGLDGHPARLDIDTADVVRRVEALPWVLSASARLQWPGTVQVDVVERRPAAVLPAAQGQWALADITGRVLQVGPDKPAGLPVIGAVDPPERAGQRVSAQAVASLRVAAALPADVRQRVADVAAVSGGEVELQLVPPGGVVRLGRPEELEPKLAALATVLARADLARIRVIDVRVPEAPALTRR